MISTEIQGIKLNLHTLNSLFSPNNIDLGTLSMISCVNVSKDDFILDLGCGYGIVGIYFAKIIGDKNVVMSDIDPKAIEISKKNIIENGVPNIKIIESDEFSNIDDTNFTMILSNPPYHSDFKLPKHFIEKGFNRLKINGRMYMVTKRKDWYKNKFISIFGGVTIKEINGYYIFIAEKRKNEYNKTR
ncbi:MAG: methyltransferase [Oscillospiraceae bacterium]|nr:methyltransferase [Oscillospiraceae bacterium]